MGGEKKKMKNKLIAAGLIAITIFMLAPLSAVIATDQNPPLTISEQGAVWTVDLAHPIQYSVNGNPVSGKDVTGIEIWASTDAQTGKTTPPGSNAIQLGYLKFSLADVQVKIWIDPSTLPAGVDLQSSYVILSFSGNLKYFSGPAPAFTMR
jgi:hypothetical protein